MKNSVSQDPPVAPSAAPERPPADLAERFKLAMLEDGQAEPRGYDPYDTSAGKPRDVWSTKRKRA